MSSDSKISDCYDGTNRTLFKKECPVCHIVFWIPKHILKKRNFCSPKCSSKNKERKLYITCAKCGVKFKRVLSKTQSPKGTSHFCSRACKDSSQTLDVGILTCGHYKDGFSSYRLRAIRSHGAICNACGYDENERMLDVDHINGNRKDNSLSNLQVLCVWCHALKTRGVPQHGPVAQLGVHSVCTRETPDRSRSGPRMLS